ncbi:MAG: SDR family oxidoreductase [Firmicutes bacterium]|nr:SDR family oxidoreductase [Bacillota bacterium]
MILDRNNKKEVIALLGAGGMGVAIVKRIAAGKKIFLGDISEKKLAEVASDFQYHGYDVETMVVDGCSKESVEAYAQKAAALGPVMYFIDSAGASPSQGKPEHIINLDLIGTSYAIDAFGKVMAEGGAGLIIASQTGYMGPNYDMETEMKLALTPTEELKDLDLLQAITRSGAAYILSKKVNQLRVRTAAATTWAQRRARINTISPGIIMTPVAYDEFQAPGNTYQNMIDQSAAKRVGTVDEIAYAGEFLLSPKSSFITGIDLLIDGGVIASLKTGIYQLGK